MQLWTTVTQAKVKPGEVQEAENADGIVVNWKHRRDVLLFSTKHNASMVDSGKKTEKRNLL